MWCRRLVAMSALVGALPVAAVAALLLGQADLRLAFAQSGIEAPAGLRWPFVLVIAACLTGLVVLVAAGLVRALRSWADLYGFAVHSFTTLAVSLVAVVVALLLAVGAVALGGGIF